MSHNVRICSLSYFYDRRTTEIERPLLAALIVSMVIMGLMFVLCAVVSIPFAMFGAAWGFESIALLVLMTGSVSTVVLATVFIHHNYRISHSNWRQALLSLVHRAWEMFWSIAAALFWGGMCLATIAIVVTYGVGVLIWLFWPGPTDWQRQLIVYPPVIIGIPAFVLGTMGYLVREWRLNKNWLRRVKAHSSH